MPEADHLQPSSPIGTAVIAIVAIVAAVFAVWQANNVRSEIRDIEAQHERQRKAFRGSWESIGDQANRLKVFDADLRSLRDAIAATNAELATSERRINELTVQIDALK